jgi:outer membrane protein OmpA-like peptidoglycan-associated protein
LSLLPDLKLHIAIFDAINRKPLKGANLLIKDEKTGKVLVEKPLGGGYTFKYEPLNFGTKYYIHSSKESFQSDSSFVTTEVYGSNRVDYYDTLYLTPFTGLPVVLYFDNDHPNPRTTTPVTKLSYGETFTSYIGKQSEFFNAYYKGNQEVSADKANEISEFFTNDVQKGYDKLLNFSSLLFNYLEEGYNLEMVLEGYASPLAATDYNRNLTARRVSSVANHLFNFNGGVLRKYLQNGQLRLRVEPYGESQAATAVSDDGLNRKLSVYSVAASRERRVQIKEVNRIESSKVEFNSDQYLNFSNYFGENPTYKIFGGGSGLYNGVTGNVSTNSYSNDLITIPTPKGKKNAKSQRKIVESYEAITYKNTETVSAKRPTMAWEVVVVDAYSKMILPNAQVQILDQYNNTRMKAKRKGNGYIVKMNDGEEYRANVTVSGYSQGAANRMMSYTEGGATLATDTVYLTPFNGLPLPLFFDNDHPNPRTNVPTTTINYDTEYKSFYARKKEFLRQINRLTGSSSEMNQFFEQEVKDGFEHLSGFAKVMQQYLAKGHQIEVILEGYTSPLAGSDYNVNLANRRVQSVINYFKNYPGFSYYLTTQKLKLTIQPFGEANSTASDDANDARSIYGLEASKARKVIIKDIILSDY